MDLVIKVAIGELTWKYSDTDGRVDGRTPKVTRQHSISQQGTKTGTMQACESIAKSVRELLMSGRLVLPRLPSSPGTTSVSVESERECGCPQDDASDAKPGLCERSRT